MSATAATETASPAAGRRHVPRGWVLAILIVVSIVMGTAYVGWAAIRESAEGRAPLSGPVDAEGEPHVALAAGGPGTILFQNGAPGDAFGRVGLVELGGREWPRIIAPLACLRVYFAAERGLCLAEDPGLVTNYAAYVFGLDFRPLFKVDLSGIPSRARVSPDGRYGATTVFVTGHSYAEGGFSTETTLIDLTTGERVANLEEFTVFRNGETFASADFNFWGVTFSSDSNRFYATLATRSQTYLVQGDIAARTAQVVHENVECPSLSPDGTRLAFKKRVNGRDGSPVWQFHVLDLATMTETPLAESRSLDDQIEWLDDNRVLYGDGTDTWVLPADGTGAPVRFLSGAASPAVVRTASAAHHQEVHHHDGHAHAPPATPVESVVLPPADLGVAITAPDQAMRAGDAVTYTITVTNHGPSEALAPRLEYAVPEGAAWGSATTVAVPGNSWGCSFSGEEQERVTCDTVALPSGGHWTLEFTVRPSQAGVLSSAVTIHGAGPDPNPANDTATSEITVADR